MPRPGFVLEVDDRTPPLLVHEGEGFRMHKFPLGTRVVYPPDSLPYQDSVVAAAANSGVRIFAVGVGPASDQGAQSVDSAVNVVRNLATRTGGIYAGVTDATHLSPALRALASEPSGERLLATFALASPPVRGAVVTGTVTIEGPLGRATAEWSFVAP